MIGERINEHDNVLIVGDWFYCSSVAPSVEGGYRQTIFTRHAPTMQERIEEFDQEFKSLLAGRPTQRAKQDIIEFLAKELRSSTSLPPKRHPEKASKPKAIPASA